MKSGIIKRGELKDEPLRLEELEPKARGKNDGFKELLPAGGRGDGFYRNKSGASFPVVDRGRRHRSAGEPDTVAQKQLRFLAEMIARTQNQADKK